MPLVPAVILASTLGTIGTLIVVPVAVAALTAIATMLVTHAGEATNRRRDRYAEAVQTLVAWTEFPYRVRRRTDDEPATIAALADRGHDLQERLACHEAWIATEHPDLARAYADARATITDVVGPAVSEAWESAPVMKASDMNLNGWGPGADCKDTITALQHQIERRFGVRRFKFWGKNN
ncbi:MAG: hypothetical protein ACRD07_06145 [Acidimicrobiales bacterium]